MARKAVIHKEKTGRKTKGGKLKLELKEYIKIFSAMIDGTGKDFPYSGIALIRTLKAALDRIQELEKLLPLYAAALLLIQELERKDENE